MELSLSTLRSKNLSALFLGLSLFTLPFQRAFLVYAPDWGRGFFNPYLSVQIHTFEIFLLLAGLFAIFHWLKEKTSPKLQKSELFTGALVLMTAWISIWYAGNLELKVQLFLSLKLSSFGLLFVLLRSKIFSWPHLIKILLSAASLQALLACGQFFAQADFGLQILGESILNDSVQHLARMDFMGMDWIRAYGSFPHPNLLAAFLLTSLLLALFFLRPMGPRSITLIIVLCFGLAATASRTAFLALAALITVYFFMKYKTWKPRLTFGVLLSSMLGVLFFLRPISLNDPALLERLAGLQYSFEAWLQSSWSGIGFRQSTFALEAVASNLKPWDYQPVHNVYVLLLSEIGVLGFIAAILFFITTARQLKKTKEIYLLFALPFILGLTDHYLLSLDQGLALFVLILALVKMASEPKQKLLVRVESPQ